MKTIIVALAVVACAIAMTGCAEVTGAESQPASNSPPATPEPAQPAAPAPSADIIRDVAIYNAIGTKVHGAIDGMETLHWGGNQYGMELLPVANATNKRYSVRGSRSDSKAYRVIRVTYSTGNRRYYMLRYAADGNPECIIGEDGNCTRRLSDWDDSEVSIDQLPTDVPSTIEGGSDDKPTLPSAVPTDNTPPAPGSGDETPPTAPAPSPGSAGDDTSVLEAPSWGYDATEAVRAFLRVYAHATTTVTIPTPAGNPVPQVRIKLRVMHRYEMGLSDSGFRLSLDPLSLTLQPQSSEAARKIVLVATNSEGSAEMEVRSTATCGYSQPAVISLWLGTHPLPTAPDGHAANETFEGQTSVTVTSTGFVVGGVTSRFWKQDRARRLGLGGGPGPDRCDVLVASADDGKIYVLDRMLGYGDGHVGHILENLSAGSTTPACTGAWSDARILSRYPSGPKRDEPTEAALISHEDCVP